VTTSRLEESKIGGSPSSTWLSLQLTLYQNLSSHLLFQIVKCIPVKRVYRLDGGKSEWKLAFACKKGAWFRCKGF